MKRYIILAAFAFATPTLAAEPTTNGYINGIQNSLNQRLDAWQAANGTQAGSTVNHQIDVAQGTFNQAFTQIKANNPNPNQTVPIGTPNIVIAPFPNLPR